ncbi:undecaprenyl-phosphate glucose phosphotransferase [Vibrio amylolyticus]|uniref:undecaprenyl-phosphate glucose phosphotransferase n=1 Tax=Vibrio amylolyticus TaxID=2847292 RepID=UPI0035523009
MEINSSNSKTTIIYRIVDSLIIWCTLYFVTLSYTGQFTSTNFLASTYAILVFLLIAERDYIYRSWRVHRLSEEAFSLCKGWLFTCIVLVFIAFFSKTSTDYSRVASGFWFVITPILLVLWRALARYVLRKARDYGYNRRRAIIIGATKTGVQLAEQLLNHPELGIEPVGFYDDRLENRLETEKLPLPFKGNVEKALKLAQKGIVQHVYIAMPMKANTRIHTYLGQFSDCTANTYLIPDFFTYNLIQSRFSSIGNIPTLSVHDTPFYGASSWIKRLQDVVLSSVIIALISPVLIAVAIGVKLTSPGPIIFKQYRYGLDGKRIKVWKFRSMSSMDNGKIVKQATKNDPRITSFGAFLRRTSLDELPQFFNVIQGHMSIVGPRPHAVAHNEEYRTIVERYMLRHKVKPGITGLAQVSGYRGETDTLEKMEKRVEFDLKYIQSWSTWLDLKIIFKTVFKGFIGKTAY